MIFKFIIIYLLIFNIWGFLLMGIDKRKAIKHKQRISERFIWQIACIGGALGIYIGMKRFRHKTLHKVFIYGIPVVIFLQVAILSMLGLFMKE